MLIISIASVIFFNSCASTTTIHSYPEDAKIYLNDSFVGYTPFILKDTKILGTTTEVTLKKEGYETLYIDITKDERLHVGALIGGLFVWVPFLWLMQYEKQYNFELTEAGTD